MVGIEQLLAEIRSAAYCVHLALAPGYLESVYQNALMIELRLRGINAQKEALISVSYKGEPVGFYKADILVENAVILEIKAAHELNPAHEAQLVNYLVATGIDNGYLMNFGTPKFRIIHKTRIYNPK